MNVIPYLVTGECTTMLVSRLRPSIIHKQLARRFHLTSCTLFSDSTSGDSLCNKDDLQERFKQVMRKVPQPVVVVTTAHTNNNVTIKRGVTCSSFTSISLKPPVVSFAMNRPSRMHNLLLKTGKFAVHVLAQNQVGYALHFSKPAIDGKDQFENIEHELDPDGMPILRDTSAVLLCQKYLVNEVGDHCVWYGEVLHSYRNGMLPQDPLLHYCRGFRSIGDETFLHAFENQTLPFKDWTHEAHLRMAWSYIRDLGKDDATPVIKSGIKKYNEQNKEKISRGYHETVTMFYIHMISEAINKFDSPQMTFEEFIASNSYLKDKDLLFQYYTDETINKKEAYIKFLPPDKKAL